MTDKTLGEIACEAYSNEVSKAEPGHKAWEAAAEAVLHFAEAEWKPVIEAEAAVIEAAKARQRYLETHQHRVCHGTENALFAAVEALEREED